MNDDLKKRLRQHRYNTWNDDLGPEPDKALAADRIEQLERERDALATDLLFYTEDRDFWKDQVTTLADRLATAHNEHTNRIELEIKLADAIKFIEEVRRNGDTRLALMAIDVLDWLRQK